MAVLEYLADRSTLAFEVPAIHRWITTRRTDLDETPGEQDVKEALLFLEGSGYVAGTPHPMGATLYWRVTAAGTVARERGPLPARPI